MCMHVKGTFAYTYILEQIAIYKYFTMYICAEIVIIAYTLYYSTAMLVLAAHKAITWRDAYILVHIYICMDMSW